MRYCRPDEPPGPARGGARTADGPSHPPAGRGRRVRPRHQALRRAGQAQGRQDAADAGRRQRPLADRPGRQDLRPRRPVGLRQDDLAQDGQPAHRADLRADPHRRRGRRDAATSPSCGGASATSSSRSACSRTRRSARTSRRCRACWAGRRTRQRARSEELLALVGLDPAKYRDRYPEPALRRRAPARRRRPGARRGPADHAHGRAVRGGRPDRPRPPPERVPAPPGGARQDDPVRDPRHRRGHQDGRPRRGLPGRRASSPSSARRPRSWPTPPRSSWRGSSARTAASSACRCSRVGDLELRPAGDRRPSATTPRTRATRAQADPFGYLLLVDAADRPLGWIAPTDIPRERRRSTTAHGQPGLAARSTSGRRSRTRSR